MSAARSLSKQLYVYMSVCCIFVCDLTVCVVSQVRVVPTAQREQLSGATGWTDRLTSGCEQQVQWPVGTNCSDTHILTNTDTY